ncbi:MAG: AAA family ATPase, partial [bacterium]
MINDQIKQHILTTYKELNLNLNSINEKLKDFQELYGKDKLSKLEGKELLYHLFARKVMNDKSLFYALEFDEKYKEFGEVWGGSVYKYTLFYSNELDSWISGTHIKNRKVISESTAIEIATDVRNKFVAAIEYLDSLSNLRIPDINYGDIEVKLSSILLNIHNKIWVNKYFNMLFPNLFIGFYNINWTKSILKEINVESSKSYFRQVGQLVNIAYQLDISNISLYQTLSHLHTDTVVEEVQEDTQEVNLTSGQNLIVYGTPGCGKSYHVKNEILLGRKNNVYRTTFFLDYTNTDFVGQILPVVNGDKVTYEFTPGPFALALKQAIANPNEEVALVIEELNRGNAASIFGDIFQLLDRDDTGTSEYSINNVNLQKYLTKELNKDIPSIVIPSNMSLIATMNTSDQNVFTLDTAFKRRWNFKKLKNT